MKNLLNLLLIVSIVLSSCSVERRLYRPGLSIQWHSIKKEAAKKTNEDVLGYTNGRNQIIQEERFISSSTGETADPSSVDYFHTDEVNLNNVDSPENSQGESESFLHLDSENEDTTRITVDEQEAPVEDDRYNEVRSSNKFGWLYILLLVLFYAILGTILYFGALYPFQAGVILLVPLSILFGLEDRAGFLFGIFGGLSYIGLFFLTGSIGFWGIFFLGFLALMLSLGLATLLDDVFDTGERKDDYPPPPPPQEANPGDDW